MRVLGVGVAGLGESGVLLDGASQPCAPVIAWFDQRGARQVQQVGAQAAFLADQFARRTGLPWDCQASMAKLLWLQSTGLTLTPAHKWSSVPEWIVHRLGGCPDPRALAGFPDRARRPGHGRTLAGGRLGGRPAHDAARHHRCPREWRLARCSTPASRCPSREQP